MAKGTWPPELSRDLADLHAQAAGIANAARQPVLISLTVRWRAVDPLALFERAAIMARERALWVAPGGEMALVGLGTAAVLEAGGEDRMRQVETAWRGLLEHTIIDAPHGVWGTGPLLLGGLSFDPEAGEDPAWAGFPAARFVLPELLYTLSDRGAWLTFNRVVDPAAAAPARAGDRARHWLSLLAVAAADGDPGAGRGGDGGEAGSGGRPGPGGEGALQRSTAGPAGAGNGPAPWPTGSAVSVEELPGAGPWQETVERALAAIREGSLRKVVLSRRVRVRGRTAIDPGAALRRLRAEYPDCFLFCVANGRASFLGASPERLARLRQGQLDTAALAGSIGRGETEERDRELGRALLDSAKERAEHAAVVDMLREELAPLCVAMTVPPAPALLRLGNVQHLYTPVRAVVRGRSVLELVARLHPTPAVGGLPREAALRFIRQHEPAARGWYAAPVGWFDRHGEGEFAVAIRSGLLRGAEALLFAGCGIVAGSDPAREYEETRLKLRPLLSALGVDDPGHGEGSERGRSS